MNKWIYPMVCSLAAVIVSLFVYNDLPERMAIHFSTSGDPDNFVGKPIGAIFAPLVMWFVPIVTHLSLKIEKDDNKRMRAEKSNASVMAAVSALLLALHLFTIAYNLGHELNVPVFATVVLGIFFVLMGNIAPRLTPLQTNRRWPALSENAHRLYARFIGRLMFVAGFIFIMLALLPNALIIPVFLIVLGLFIAGTIGSMLYYARMNH